MDMEAGKLVKINKEIVKFIFYIYLLIAEFAKNHLAAEFQNRILVNKQKYSDDDQIIINSLRESFDIVEQTIINNVKNSYEMGFGQTSRAGACTLAAFIHNNKLYSANIGDCKGVVLRLENNQYKCLKINHKLNANSKKEQQRLRRDFPNDSDIVVCRKVIIL